MNWRSLLILPPIALGVVGFLFMMQDDPQQPTTPVEASTPVRVKTLRLQPLTMVAEGFGRVEAARSWSAVAEVPGRVVTLIEGLDVGTIVEPGETLFAIDPTDFQIRVAKAEANIAAAEAQVEEIERQVENTLASLKLEQRSLTVAEAEYARVDGLVERGASTAAARDQAERALIAQKEGVQSLENALALFPAQRKTLEATLAVRKAELTEAQRDLANTVVASPFRGRATMVSLEIDQYVRAGDTVAVLEGTEASEVVAELQPSAFGAMMRMAMMGRPDTDLPADVTKAVEVIRGAGVSAKVRATSGAFSGEWPAEIVRFRGSNDAETGTLGVVARVENPNAAEPLAGRPPLSNGTFVSVDFSAPTRSDLIAAPRSALHQDEDGAYAFVADDESRLSRRDLQLGPVIGEDVVVLSGLAPGDRLVLSRVSPPILGMKLTLVEE